MLVVLVCVVGSDCVHAGVGVHVGVGVHGGVGVWWCQLVLEVLGLDR